MRRTIYGALLIGVTAVTLAGGCAGTPGTKSKMSFFVTSANPGKGGDLGGLDGADKYCQKLGAAAGAAHRTWHAYLSKQPLNGEAGINARDRIGKGPWTNAKGDLVAISVDDLH